MAWESLVLILLTLSPNFSRAYLHHLFRAGEMTYFRLASIHNLAYYLDLAREAREAILKGEFQDFYQNFYSNLEN